MATTMCSLTTPVATSSSSLLDRAPHAGASRLALFRAPTCVPCPSVASRAQVAPAPRSTARLLALAQDVDFGADTAGPVVGTKLYVGNLPWNVDSASLAEIFQEAGIVEEVEVITDRDTGRSRGFAFVVMSTPEDAQAAIERFDGSDMGGRSLRVNFPSPAGQRRERRAPGGDRERRAPRVGAGSREENPNKLYVGNLSWGVDDLALQDLFSEFGKVLEARVVTDRDTGRSRGFGFVTLSNQSEVGAALSNLNGAEFDGRQLRVNPAGEKPGL